MSDFLHSSQGVIFMVALLVCAGASHAISLILGLCIGVEQGKRLGTRTTLPIAVDEDADDRSQSA